MFPRFMNPQRFELFEPHLNAGFAKSGSQKSLATYDVCPFVPISMGDDLNEARLPIKQNLALYIGGMGARDKNFYNDAAKRMGYEVFRRAAAYVDRIFKGDLTGQRYGRLRVLAIRTARVTFTARLM